MISTSVAPVSAAWANSRSTIAAPVAASRFAGRLVGEQQDRAARGGAGDADALLLAPRELAGIVAQPVAKTDAFEFRPRPRERIGDPGKLKWHRDVFECGHRRDQVKRLQHDADAPPPRARQPILVERGEVGPGNRHADPDVARSSPDRIAISDDLPDPDAPRIATCSPTAHRQVDPAQDVDGGVAAPEPQGDIARGDDDMVGHAFPGRRRLRRSTYGAWRALCHLWLLVAAMTASMATAGPLILAFGDSLTAGYQLPPGDGFAPQLEAALRAKGIAATVHNAGVSGDTTTQGRARLNWVLTGLKAKPDLVILELGANDMLRGEPVARAKANLDAMLTEFGKRGVPVVLAGMFASPNLGRVYATEFNAMYPALAKSHNVTLYPFFMDGVVGVAGMQLGDGMHPTKAGVAVIVRRILPTVTRALGK